jgi:hypothetical protein
LSSKDRYEFDIKRSVSMAKMTRDSGDLEATKAMLGAGVGSALMPDGNALGLHFVMFVPTIMGQVIHMNVIALGFTISNNIN